MSPAVLEGQRQGAKFIEQKSADPGEDLALALFDIHAVATPLSSSLGQPAKTVTVKDKDAAIRSLQKSNLAIQKKADDWKAFALKYQGKDLEGTGINLSGIGGFVGLGTILALIIFVPGGFTVFLFIIRRLRSSLTQVAQSIEEYATKNPDGAKDLKTRLSSNLDRAEKSIVEEVKKNINLKKIQEIKNEPV
jgi:hypothetical protein